MSRIRDPKILFWSGEQQHDFERPIEVAEGPKDRANNEGSGLGQSKIGPSTRLLNICTQSELANVAIINVLTTGKTQEANVISS